MLSWKEEVKHGIQIYIVVLEKSGNVIHRYLNSLKLNNIADSFKTAVRYFCRNSSRVTAWQHGIGLRCLFPEETQIGCVTSLANHQRTDV